jgi:hypothetical protein
MNGEGKQKGNVNRRTIHLQVICHYQYLPQDSERLRGIDSYTTGPD